MSVYDQKRGWLRNWKSAQEKFSAFVSDGNREMADFWCGIALEIELQFGKFFGEPFGIFLENIFRTEGGLA